MPMARRRRGNQSLPQCSLPEYKPEPLLRDQDIGALNIRNVIQGHWLLEMFLQRNEFGQTFVNGSEARRIVPETDEIEVEGREEVVEGMEAVGDCGILAGADMVGQVGDADHADRELVKNAGAALGDKEEDVCTLTAYLFVVIYRGILLLVDAIETCGVGEGDGFADVEPGRLALFHFEEGDCEEERCEDVVICCSLDEVHV